MSKEKIKVYLYTRVSTSIQIDGYSLEAQKSRMKAFALYNDYEIVGEYEDAGKSGKSIEGRIQFTRMMEDIKSGKDGVSFVLVFKLSRFAVGSSSKIMGELLRNTLASPSLWRSPPERVSPSSPTSVSYPLGKVSMNSSIEAFLQAVISSSSVASCFAIFRFSAMLR